MIYVFLTVSISVSLLIVFKAFEKFKVNTLYAIILNYLFAGLTGIVFLKFQTGELLFYKSDAWHITLPMGILFISVFYAISQTAQKISISIASVANKMSVILPVLFSLIVLNESISIAKLIGIILAVVAVVFTMYRKSGSENKNLIMLPFLVFIGSGMIDIGMNYANTAIVKTETDTYLFSTSIFITSFCCGLLFLLIQWLYTKKNSIKLIPPNNKDIVGGILLGIPNYFSIFFMLKALGSGFLTPALLFPVLNVSNVLLTALIGLLAFKEMLSKLNYLGLLLAVISLILIAT